jgi:hypothetical protein
MYASTCDRCQAGDHCRGASDQPLTPEDIIGRVLGGYKCICKECKDTPHFTCPYCRTTSWNADDIANRYCGNCHRFVEKVTSIL